MTKFIKWLQEVGIFDFNDVGGKNASSVNSKTFVLLVKSLEDTSSKIEEAKKLEVRIMIPDDFIREYEL